MTTFTVTTDCGTRRDFETRREAEEGKEVHQTLCEECDEADIRVTAEENGASATEKDGAAPVPGAPGTIDEPPLPSELTESLQTDPLDLVPEYMIDVVDGQPTINKRGYAVIANHFDIVVRAEAITTAGETDHQYAEFKAHAWRRGDDPEQGYSGHATARASEERRGIENNLNEMAETRAMKRAVAWASGVGILAWEELAGAVESEGGNEPSRPVESSAD